MNFILLEGAIPFGSVLGYALSIAITVLWFIIKTYLKRVDIRLCDLEKAKEEAELSIEKALTESNAAISAERNRSTQEMRVVDARITDLHINILNRLDEIKDKFQEARK